MRNLIARCCSLPSADMINAGIAFMRVGLGVLSVCHGAPKLLGGPQVWSGLGLAMGNFGIHFWPALWGFLAAAVEFFGGVAFILGLGTRSASFALASTMVVALVFHLKNGDAFSVYSFPLTLIVVFLGFIQTGGGSFSLDGFFARLRK